MCAIGAGWSDDRPIHQPPIQKGRKNLERVSVEGPIIQTSLYSYYVLLTCDPGSAPFCRRTTAVDH